MAAGSLSGIVRASGVAVLTIVAVAGAAPVLAVDCSGLSEWNCSTSYGAGILGVTGSARVYGRDICD